jgi:hypothetical protein
MQMTQQTQTNTGGTNLSIPASQQSFTLERMLCTYLQPGRKPLHTGNPPACAPALNTPTGKKQGLHAAWLTCTLRGSLSREHTCQCVPLMCTRHHAATNSCTRNTQGRPTPARAGLLLAAARRARLLRRPQWKCNALIQMMTSSKLRPLMRGTARHSTSAAQSSVAAHE